MAHDNIDYPPPNILLLLLSIRASLIRNSSPLIGLVLYFATENNCGSADKETCGASIRLSRETQIQKGERIRYLCVLVLSV